MTLIYIHGFNSGGNPESSKVKEFEKMVDDVRCLTYDTFVDREAIIAKLWEDIRTILDDPSVEDVVIVGTSLGGYYASVLSRIFGLRGILINPATNPYNDLSDAVGKEMTNYVTSEVRTLSKETLESYKGHPIYSDPSDYKEIPTVMICLDDDYIDPIHSLEVLKKLNPISLDKGGHTFEFDEYKLRLLKTILTF